jgi:titin
VGAGGLSNPTYVTPATVPDAPGAMTARRQDSGTDLSWTIPSNNGGDPITGYRIQVQQGNQRPTSFVTTGSPYSIRGLDNGSTYSVTVSAINSVGDSVASESARVTPATNPLAPRAITVQRQDRAADISWTAPSNNGGDPITGYRVHVRKGSESPLSYVAAESPYSIRGLENGTTYSVNVNAINSVGDSVASESASVTPATVPDAPRAFAALRRDKAADVSWLAPLNDGGDHVTSYRVQIWHGDGPSVTFVTTESRYSIQGLKNGTTYSAKVSAINSVGDSVASESMSVTPATVPTAPFALMAVRQDRAVEVSWAVPTNDGGDRVTGYRVLVSKGNEPVTSYVTTETHYSLRGLENGKTYSISVGAINSVGESGASELVMVTPATVPDVPRAIVAVRHDKSADVSWEVPSNDGGDPITGYRVHVRKGDEKPLIFVATGSPYSLAGLDNGTTYAVTVSAINSAGDGVASESIAVTPATVPTPPRAITAQRQDRAVNVSWTAPWSDGGDPVIGHHVRVWVEATIVAEIETSNSSVVVAGLNNGTQYRVTATSFNSVGESVASDSAFVTPATIPAAPLAVTTLRQNSGAAISWTVPPNDGGDPITGYHVRVQAGNQPPMRFITTESWYSIRGLDNGTTYGVTVSAINSVGESTASDSIEVTPATIPLAPHTIIAQRLDHAADISWTAPSNDGGDPIIGYWVQVQEGNDVAASFLTAETTYSIRGLDNGTTYAVTVSAINSVGESVASESAEVTPATIPGPPRSLINVRRDSGFNVSWEAPSNDGGDPVTAFQIQVQQGTRPPTRFITTESPYSIRGLDNGTTYAVTVSAINSVGESVASESAEVTPATIPDLPTLLNMTATDGGAELEWCVPLNNGGAPLTGYRVRVWSEANVIAEFDTSISRVSVTGLTNGEEYRITVTSLNSVGESVASQQGFVTPTSPPIIEPPIVEPPVIEPPIVEPPIVEPPIVEPPIVEPPIVDPPPAVRPPSPPIDVAVISTTRKFVTVGWRVVDSGGTPVIDFIVHVSRYKNRDFTVWSDATSATPRVELRKPRRGSLYVRVIAVTRGGESAPTHPIRVVPTRG